MMKRESKRGAWNGRQSGQTLVIAIIVMGILIILGIAFSLIISNSIGLSSEAQRRAVANDLAKAGIETMHERMLNSSADAAFVNTNPIVFPADFTRDPDALYLRPGSGLTYPSASGDLVDLGGPDGRGPFVRFEFAKGRALVRVRYAPSDYDAFADPTGALRNPGRARRYLIIESVGRPGSVEFNDPTTQLSESVKVQNFVDAAELAVRLAEMHSVDGRVTPSRKMMAFATIGIGDDAMFITDIDEIRKPAEIGSQAPGSGGTVSSSASMSAFFRGNPVVVPMMFGVDYPEPNAGQANSWTTASGGGSLRSNTSLIVHGTIEASVNYSLAESISVAGEIIAANDASAFLIKRTYYDPATDQWRSNYNANPSTVNNPLVLDSLLLASTNPAFSTYNNVYRDGEPIPDPSGFPRGVRPIKPPRIDRVDSQGRDNYYVEITRNSGPIVNGQNIGRYGYGQGVYVDYMSPYNLQRRNEDDRDVNASNSLVDMWFNPNARDTAAKGGSWEGPYFVPDASYLRLLPDGFAIIRPGNSGEQQNADSAFWRVPATGASSGQSVCRYRLRTIAGQTWILNSIQQPDLVALAAADLTDADFIDFGLPFEGVVYFEGDVRVRGVIPTHQQLTVISMGNIYIDGSISKGIVTEGGVVISEPSRSMLSLLARDHVAVNTTQFFAPVPNDMFDTKDDSPLPDTPTPVELGVDGDSGVDSDIVLQFQLEMQNFPDPGHLGINPANPQTWEPYSTTYAPWNGANAMGSDFDVFMMLVASANDGGPSYVSAAFEPQTFADPAAALETAYLFSRIFDFATAGAITFNAADPFYVPGGKIPVYGVANPSINIFPKFEAVEFPIVTTTGWAFVPGDRRLVPAINNPEGQYELALSDETYVRLRNNPIGTTGQKEFLIARSGIVPFDVRIEANVYAQYGSFYVIPGSWFNMNNDDTRERFEDDVVALGRDEAQRLRFEQFGNTSYFPFAGEPMDCKVTIVGAVSQNMPPPISRQGEWMQKWGWIPKEIGGTGLLIPWQHVPLGYDLNVEDAVPNFVIVHDPALAGASADGTNPLRTDAAGRSLPPTPRLPVSPTLVYFGDMDQ